MMAGVTRSEPAPVEVSSIEKELGRLWKEEASGLRADESPVTRACLLNLIVLTRASEADPALAGDLVALFRDRPCRILVLELEDEAPGEEVKAWISAHCIRPSGEEKQVCCEQVTLRASRRAAAHLPSLTRSLTASDLPVFIYLPFGPLREEGLLQDLSRTSDRIIVDSACLTLDELAGLAGAGEVADLGWSRLLGFRASVADLFDSPLLSQLLKQIEGIRTDGGPRSETAAGLLHGWVRAVLGTTALATSHRIHPSAKDGNMERLILDAGSGTRIVVERDPSTDLLLARAEMPGSCPLPRRRRYREKATAELLRDELDRAGADPIFLEALAAAGPAVQ